MSTVRKWVPLAVLLVAALGLSACSGTAAQAQPHTISVTGTGIARLAPDIVLITLGVHTQGTDVAEAVSENNQRAAGVMEVIRQAGVADADIGTANFSVYTQQQFDATGTPTGEILYSVDNNINVTLRQIAELGDLLEAALRAGANSVQGVTYSVEDPTEALDAARLEAMRDAQDQAQQLAAAAGLQLGPVQTVGEPSYYPVPVYAAPSYGKGGGGGVPTTAGTLEYTVQLSVVYTVR